MTTGEQAKKKVRKVEISKELNKFELCLNKINYQFPNNFVYPKNVNKGKIKTNRK